MSAISKKKPRVAIIATPWIKIPPDGYGGIEAVLDGLVEGLVENDVEVEIFGVAQRQLHGCKVHTLYKDEQYRHIYRPVFESLPILIAHLEWAISKIIEDGNFDVVHDHNGFLGPHILKWVSKDPDFPPVVHTLHGPSFFDNSADDPATGLPSNRNAWRYIGSSQKINYVGISNSLVANIPSELKKSLLPTVYNAVDLNQFPFVRDKKNYYITLGRFTEDKGQHIAAKYCAKFRYRLRMAGSVVDINNGRKLLMELANPLSSYRSQPDFRYYSDQILPYTIRNPRITFAGNIAGKKKMKFLSEAKALLFPIQWEEPFGMVVIEALACGTPVVAMRRGAMPEIIEHGVNGFLCDSEEEFAEYMKRIDEIDPEACRRSVEEKFSSDVMARQYIKRYRKAIKRASASR